jgi:hypothetical protein
LYSEKGNLSQMYQPEFRTLLHLERREQEEGEGQLQIPLPLHMSR